MATFILNSLDFKNGVHKETHCGRIYSGYCHLIIYISLTIVLRCQNGHINKLQSSLDSSIRSRWLERKAHTEIWPLRPEHPQPDLGDMEPSDLVRMGDPACL